MLQRRKRERKGPTGRINSEFIINLSTATYPQKAGNSRSGHGIISFAKT